MSAGTGSAAGTQEAQEEEEQQRLHLAPELWATATIKGACVGGWWRHASAQAPAALHTHPPTATALGTAAGAKHHDGSGVQLWIVWEDGYTWVGGGASAAGCRGG